MQLKLDLHVHTVYSGDSVITLKKAVEAAEKAGLDGIAITDHDTVDALKEIPSHSSILILEGIEVSSLQGHILGLGVSARIPQGLPASDTVDRIRRLGGVAVVAHPFNFLKRSLNGEAIRRLKPDAVEAINASSILPLTIRKAVQAARELGLPQVGGSDSHIPETIGKAYTLVEVEEASREAVLQALKAGKTRAEGRKISPVDFLRKIGWQMKIKGGCTFLPFR
ncbi:PHP domain-containing protein [Candidatus Hecatella orcuttiae]|jgi:hypothetical protein|uniref:PHP domain-containing protein n=1 Tax=Candidatus Hecatella orcuttiae TaxID=1935119 RepID=UPI002867EF40|nr:PHP domain-containing protein [Candidatus Hecatella orcuttiae]